MKKEKFPKEIIVWQDYALGNPSDKWYVVETDMQNLTGEEEEIAIYSRQSVKKIRREIKFK